MQRVERFFAGGDYQVTGKLELYLQNTLWVLFKLLGLYVDVERHTTDGRMDILIQTHDYVYILELKIDQSADVALQQIETKQTPKFSRVTNVPFIRLASAFPLKHATSLSGR